MIDIIVMMVVASFTRKKQHSFFRQRSQSLDQPCKPYNMVEDMFITNINIVIIST